VLMVRIRPWAPLFHYISRNNFKGEILMQIDQVEWLRRENYFLREQNKILKNELSETKKYLEEILTKFKDINKGN
tara:strand:+ start:42 stop:266 length:225 start_codon:yes stop_codon:yes gene_type:complete